MKMNLFFENTSITSMLSDDDGGNDFSACWNKGRDAWVYFACFKFHQILPSDIKRYPDISSRTISPEKIP